MRSTFSLAFGAALIVGCAEREAAPVAGPVTAPGGDSEPTPAAVESASAAIPAAPAYPESEEVQGLLYRARELQRAGQFQEALALADQALARDPNSPAAAALRGELWGIVTKI